MTSPNHRSHRAHLWWANARVGLLLFCAHMPWLVLLLGLLLPGVLSLVVYVLIGQMTGGRDGMIYAYVGCVVLAAKRAAISDVSDIPVGDADQRTFTTVRRGSLSPLWQYTGRATVYAGLALVESTLAWLCLGLVVGDPGLFLRVAAVLPVVAVAVPWAIMFGFVAIAPAIGNDYQNLVHNLASALVTVCSGAIFPTTVNPVLDTVSQVMPLHHAVDAARVVVAGGSGWSALGCEALVGMGWTCIAIVVYRIFDLRGRHTGTGAFAA